jgi:protein ImuB
MSRIVSVWLPRWPILRALAAQTKQQKQAKQPTEKLIAPDRPLVLAVAAAGGPRIAALNEAAEAAGLAIGEPLADARAKAGFLQVRAADPAADAAALRRLTLWATRYTPTASSYDEASGADGFFLDVEGSSHLFGGEEKLVTDLAARLKNNFGLPARLAVADTAGAGWAASRFHGKNSCILPPGRQAETLALLPVEALRLSPEISATLRRLGLKTVGALLDKPRAPFAARFSAQLLRRFDQALGRVDEPLVPVTPPPVYHSLRYLLEPIVAQEAVVALASRLMQTLERVLARDDVGARGLKLALYRVDGEVKTLDIALTLPTRSVAHVARLIALRLESAATTDDAGFGFEAVGLAVTRAEPLPARQTELTSAGLDDRSERCAALIDKLQQRLGPHSVRRFAAVASHIPERAEMLTAVNGAALQVPAPERRDVAEADLRARPLLLLPHAEPAEEVMALVPEGPPRRFRWRGVTYEIEHAEGPERIAAEWWRTPPSSAHHDAGERQGALTRDYYLVEDLSGHRFWLFREGLYGRETTDAHWFVHGLFA